MSETTPERATVHEYYEEHPYLKHVPSLFKLYKDSVAKLATPSVAEFAEWLDETPQEDIIQLMNELVANTDGIPENS